MACLGHMRPVGHRLDLSAVTFLRSKGHKEQCTEFGSRAISIRAVTTTATEAWMVNAARAWMGADSVDSIQDGSVGHWASSLYLLIGLYKSAFNIHEVAIKLPKEQSY